MIVDVAAAVLVVALAVTGLALIRQELEGRLVAVQLATVIAIHLTLVLSARDAISYYSDVGIVLAVIAAVGGLVFARFLERWL